MEMHKLSTAELETLQRKCYMSLREAIIEAEKHPGDEEYKYAEYIADEEYCDVMFAYEMRRIRESEERQRRMEATGELPF